MKSQTQIISVQRGIKHPEYFTLFVSLNKTGFGDKYLYTVVRNADMEVMSVCPRPSRMDDHAVRMGIIAQEDFPLWAL
jgi:hypothetical protein